MSITVYSKPACVYCDKAKALLTRLGYKYTEKVVTKDISLPELFEELGKQVRTIPQITIAGKHIGGYNELTEYFLEQGKINFKGEII
ncbi:MAG: glutathione S-transferase N-terminal domain-containing protein [Pelagibacteraceae bacterium]|nr:glutathione S-transferase N-terminal domain-containing protein [Pelagibacteraceae bacterium]